MNQEISSFAARLREVILSEGRVPRGPDLKGQNGGSCNSPLRNLLLHDFNHLALELFALQFQHNPAYRKICTARKLTPDVVEHWTQIPAVPTAAFKELELSCIAPAERTAVFHSSGTTEQKPSRHFHCPASLEFYESSLWPWFQANMVFGAPNSGSACSPSYKVRADLEIGAPKAQLFQLVVLTPPASQAPHSSLVHMFETIRQKIGGASVPASRSEFFGKITADGAWTLDFKAALATLNSSIANRQSSILLGTAFSFVHLLDYFAEKELAFQLPPGSRVMETGGYKNRSRSMPKTELHQFITERLGVPPENIICEYGMCELSSQAYDPRSQNRMFQFPPLARVQIISPETGREVAGGETGLIRVFDLANVFSVMAIQTEDLGIRRGAGFELIGRAQLAEPRGCSLMTA